MVRSAQLLGVECLHTLPLFLVGGTDAITEDYPSTHGLPGSLREARSHELLRFTSKSDSPNSQGESRASYSSLRRKKRDRQAGDSAATPSEESVRLSQAVSVFLNSGLVRGTYGAPAPHPSRTRTTRTWVREVRRVLVEL